MSQELDPNHAEWKSFTLAMRCDQGRHDTPRLVFADWLDEQYPGNSFAQLIRLMIETDQRFPDSKLTVEGWDLPDSFGRMPLVKQPLGWMADTWMRWPPLAALLADDEMDRQFRQHGEAGPTLMLRLAQQCEFRRGFPDKLVLPWGRWMLDCDAICAIGPVGDVVLVDNPGLCVAGGQSVFICTPTDSRLTSRVREDQATWLIPIAEYYAANDTRRLVEFPRQVCENVLREAFVRTEMVRSIRIDESLLPNRGAQ